MNSGYRNMKLNSDNGNSKPLPIDTINRFWGVDSRILKHDDTVQKQSFDQGYKNFWSYVDFYVEIQNSSFDNNTNSRMTNNNNTNVNYSGMSTSNNLKNSNSGLSYLEARRRADELLRNGSK